MTHSPSPHINNRGLMFVISSPSGAGKTSICRNLLAVEANITFSVSMTTRDQRPGEVEGKDYYFITQATFDEHVNQENFLENASVFGNSYGTPRHIVEDMLEKGIDVLFDIDWQGAIQLMEKAPEDVVTIFVFPPSLEELEKRLRKRNRDSEEDIQRRMEQAKFEMSQFHRYNYVVINEDLEHASEEVRAIYHAEKLKTLRQEKTLAYFFK